MNAETMLCLECDGEGYLPGTGKQADSFRLCEACNGKGRVINQEIDKNNKPNLRLNTK